MSFTGIFIAHNGMVAVADSKGSTLEDGKLAKDVWRTPEKLFVLHEGVAVTYGANEYHYQRPHGLFPETIHVEDDVREYLAKHPTLDAEFFQQLLLKVSSTAANTAPITFLVGRKIRSGQYRLEHHQLKNNTYIQRIATKNQWYFTGGDEIYLQAINHMDLTPYQEDAAKLQEELIGRIHQLIDFYDDALTYNSVGRPIRSYVMS